MPMRLRRCASRRTPLPDVQELQTRHTREPGTPRHVAVIMDGNGRWARSAHCRATWAIARASSRCARPSGLRGRGVEALTLFAFSSENWGRPAEEVSRLMELFVGRWIARSRSSRGTASAAFIGDSRR